jgi:NitT/TauT family transport system permease protein
MPEYVKSWLGALASFGGLFIIWHLATTVGGVSPQVLPPLADVAESARRGLWDGLLYPHISFTIGSTLTGIAIGATLGLITAILVNESALLEDAIYPVVTAIQSVPKVAIAPLIIVYFGLGMASKVFTVALLSFFPVFVNAVAGFKSVDPELLDLFRTFKASRLHVLLNVRLPAAGAYLFNGIRIGIIYGIIGCITSEFVASTRGLGFIIKSRAGELDVSLMFVCIFVLSACAAATIAVLTALERRTLFWIPRNTGFQISER